MLFKKYPANETVVVNHFNDGKTLREIADLVDASIPAVREALRRNGVDTTANANNRPHPISPMDDNAEFIAALGTDTDRAIGRRFGVSYQTVCNHRKRRDIAPFGYTVTTIDESSDVGETIAISEPAP